MDHAVRTHPAPGLAEIRAAIDGIDRDVVHLLAEREAFVRQAAACKSDENAVRAPGRVEDVISKVRLIAEQSGGTPDVVEQVYRTMIRCFIELELREHHART